MISHPSNLIYQASATHRRDLRAEAALEQRASRRRRAQLNDQTVSTRMRQRAGSMLVALGNRLARTNNLDHVRPSTVE